MWDKPITFRQASWLAGTLTLGVVTTSFGYNLKQNEVNLQRDYSTCLERSANIIRSNENWSKVVVKPGEKITFYTAPNCTKP